MLSQIWKDFFLVPDMVSGGQNGYPKAQQLVHQGRSDPKTRGGILAVGKDQVRLILRYQLRQALFQNAAPWPSKNITDVKNSYSILQDSPGKRLRGEGNPAPHAKGRTDPDAQKVGSPRLKRPASAADPAFHCTRRTSAPPAAWSLRTWTSSGGIHPQY